ncbi:ribokinase [Neptunicoccus cionae]|uniref:Ribokinase n=1 Tax=Neptunicoccus cionae TaxID=2035344 RepID=A0A916VPI3_9RHOB|nr:ribokinase [Amylibacter cionae]GGA16802.1 ribokinase [Amylibacter cionae]
MILNFGSINLDLVYRVPHLPAAGETLASSSFEKYLGGKGINQSIAAHRSGAQTLHLGCVGPDGDWLREQIAGFGLSLDGLRTVTTPTGHAVIFVDDSAENQIVLFGGSNQAFTTDQFEAALAQADPATDWVLCQNETNNVPKMAQLAKAKGLRVAYSAAPFDADHAIPLLDHIDLLAVNEGEAAALQSALGKDIQSLGLPYLLITKGSKGATLYAGGQQFDQDSFTVTPKDTTGAGDTFLGAFVAELSASDDPAKALQFAAAAAAVQVTRAGAAPAIPTREDTLSFLKANT